MTVEITWQTIITAGAVITALTAIVTLAFKVVRWFDQQNKQETKFAALESKHNTDIAALKKAEAEDIAAIKNEQQILTYGILACLKGLKEQGCNGPVTEAINKIEKHLNARAHE